jgi:negative regulator of sigma E activity
MSHSTNSHTDKFDAHCNQQLSALMDGELAPDEARFLLRRLQHDEELAGRFERWQLCGDVLRGHACAPAPADFSRRVAAAVAAEATVPFAVRTESMKRGGWARWGGGAALAASVAAVALFVARSQLPGEDAASSAALIAANPAAMPQRGFSDVTAAAPAAALKAGNTRRPEAARRGSGATGSQQVARTAARKSDAPVSAVAASGKVAPAAANGALPVAPGNPFVAALPAQVSARPWPRSVLPQGAGASGAFNASFQTESPARAAFYPFEPRLQHPLPSPHASDLLPQIP